MSAGLLSMGFVVSRGHQMALRSGGYAFSTLSPARDGTLIDRTDNPVISASGRGSEPDSNPCMEIEEFFYKYFKYDFVAVNQKYA